MNTLSLDHLGVWRELSETLHDPWKRKFAREQVAYWEEQNKKPYVCPYCKREVPNKENDYCEKCI
jgi:hypothetical protein